MKVEGWANYCYIKPASGALRRVLSEKPSHIVSHLPAGGDLISNEPAFKCGYVALLGRPNVGKSTLLNSLLQQRISIVTPKPQTTRHKILGVLTQDFWQMIFLDTPGFITPKYRLQEHMMKSVESALDDADILLMMVDVASRDADEDVLEEPLVERIRASNKVAILALNKVDKVEKPRLLPIIERYDKLSLFREIVPVSALTGENLDDLKKTLVQYLPEHPPFYSPDTLTEHPEKFFVSEIVRESVFQKLREEVPYSVAVDVVEFKERGAEFEASEEGKPVKDFISAEIYVERQSQKGILIGKGGRMLKEIGERSRREVERFLQRPVYLELHVKVRPKWREDEKWLKRLGY